jgi:transposase-like protein
LAHIALDALRGDLTLGELAPRYGVHATQIATWRKQLPAHADEVFENGNLVVEIAERRIRDLRAAVD